ncbi:MAG: hypothetical protein R6X02_29685 [Enhygromyxa sp.]
MRARVDLSISFAVIVGVATPGCTRDNPAFDADDEAQSHETAAEGTEADTNDELPSESGEEESPMLCGLEGGSDMIIKVPQPCGETNDSLALYDHWFEVAEASGSTLSVHFCQEACAECEPIPADLTLSPLPMDELVGPGACLRMQARRLGEGDDCNYHAVSIQEPAAAGRVVVLARRTELLELPELETHTGLFGFDPQLLRAEGCDCEETPDSCCGTAAPTLYDYDVNGTVIPLGQTQTVSIGQNNYEFWAFDAFDTGECDVGTRIAWALTAKQ